MKIGILSDTHSYLDPKVVEYFKDVDEIWHAGDVGDIRVIDELEAFKPVVGVYGNIDNHEVRLHWPEFQRFKREGVEILMTHIAGKPGRYSKKVVEEIEKNGAPKVFVCGHSHILLIKFDPRYNMLWINPGAFGAHGFHQVRTLVRFEILKGEIKNMEIIELPR